MYYLIHQLFINYPLSIQSYCCPVALRQSLGRGPAQLCVGPPPADWKARRNGLEWVDRWIGWAGDGRGWVGLGGWVGREVGWLSKPPKTMQLDENSALANIPDFALNVKELMQMHFFQSWTKKLLGTHPRRYPRHQPSRFLDGGHHNTSRLDNGN